MTTIDALLVPHHARRNNRLTPLPATHDPAVLDTRPGVAELLRRGLGVMLFGAILGVLGGVLAAIEFTVVFRWMTPLWQLVALAFQG